MGYHIVLLVDGATFDFHRSSELFTVYLNKHVGESEYTTVQQGLVQAWQEFHTMKGSQLKVFAASVVREEQIFSDTQYVDISHRHVVRA